MPTVTLQEARATLPDLLHDLMPGEEVTIIENGRIVGRLLPGEPPLTKSPRTPNAMTESVVDTTPHSDAASTPGLGNSYIRSHDDERSESVGRWPCKAGSAKNTIHWMAPDFDAPLDEFKEYME